MSRRLGHGKRAVVYVSHTPNKKHRPSKRSLTAVYTFAVYIYVCMYIVKLVPHECDHTSAFSAASHSQDTNKHRRTEVLGDPDRSLRPCIVVVNGGGGDCGGASSHTRAEDPHMRASRHERQQRVAEEIYLFTFWQVFFLAEKQNEFSYSCNTNRTKSLRIIGCLIKHTVNESTGCKVVSLSAFASEV